MKTCFSDFINWNEDFDILINTQENRHQRMKKFGDCGTFSILYDTEQLVCISYALPRILDLHEKYGVKATFFVTNIP